MFKNISEETKFRVRVVALVIIVFAATLLIALYASLAPWLKLSQTPVTYIPVNNGTNSIYPLEFVNDNVQIIINYVDGKLVYEGVVQKPSPCHKLTTSSQVSKTYPETVAINLDVTGSDSGDVCITVISPEQFKGEVAVSTVPTVEVYYNDVVLEFE